MAFFPELRSAHVCSKEIALMLIFRPSTVMEAAAVETAAVALSLSLHGRIHGAPENKRQCSLQALKQIVRLD